MAEQYVNALGEPIAGVMATDPDGLPVIDDYQEVADLPTVYNELSNATQAGLNNRLSQTSPSVASNSDGFRRIWVSTDPADPAFGSDGDLWFQREA